MPDFKQPNDLSRQIPNDVKERTRKAGVKDVDWYAGRLTSSDSHGFTEVPLDEQRELQQMARSRRRDRRLEKKAAFVAFMRARLSLLKPHRPRHAR